MGSIPTASTISMTALRGLDQFQDLQGGSGFFKVWPDNSARDRHQADRTKDSSEEQGRPDGFLLEHFLPTCYPTLLQSGCENRPGRPGGHPAPVRRVTKTKQPELHRC